MKIEDLRVEIDTVNEEIIALLAKRLVITKQIAQVKKELNLPIDDFNRETIQRNQIKSAAKKHGLSPNIVEEMFTLFVDYTKMRMKLDPVEKSDA